MPWNPPTLRSLVGDTGADNGAYTRTFSVQANAGDLVTLAITTSNYPLVVTGVSGGGITFNLGDMRERGSGYGNAYVYSGQSPTTQTFTLTVTFQNYVNTTVYYHKVLIYVWGSHGGPGYAGAWRGSGEPWMNVAQAAERSAIISGTIDWNANTAQGTYHTDAGAATNDGWFDGGAGNYWHFSHRNSAGISTKRVGTFGVTSTRLTQAALEIKGLFVDTTAPSVPAAVVATATGRGQNTVTWNTSTDDVGTTGYQVKRNGVVIADVGLVNSYVDSTAVIGTSYTYTVNARDAAGNRSADSAASAAVMTRADRFFHCVTKPSLMVGGSSVSALYLGTNKLWP